MAEYTAIRVTEDAKSVAEESKRDGETWNEFIQRCAENPPEVREFVEADGSGGSDGLTYDDVKAACGAAVRDELPEELR